MAINRQWAGDSEEEGEKKKSFEQKGKGNTNCTCWTSNFQFHYSKLSSKQSKEIERLQKSGSNRPTKKMRYALRVALCVWRCWQIKLSNCPNCMSAASINTFYFYRFFFWRCCFFLLTSLFSFIVVVSVSFAFLSLIFRLMHTGVPNKQRTKKKRKEILPSMHSSASN